MFMPAFMYMYIFVHLKKYFSFLIGLKTYNKKDADIVVAKDQYIPSIFLDLFKTSGPNPDVGLELMHFYVRMD